MVETWRSPKALNSAVRIESTDTPIVLARSRLIWMSACRPRNCASLVMSLKIGLARIFSCSLPAQMFNSPAFTLCKMYW